MSDWTLMLLLIGGLVLAFIVVGVLANFIGPPAPAAVPTTSSTTSSPPRLQIVRYPTMAIQ